MIRIHKRKRRIWTNANSCGKYNYHTNLKLSKLQLLKIPTAKNSADSIHFIIGAIATWLVIKAI